MRWPRDGQPAPGPGDELLRRMRALKEPIAPVMPWETRLRVWWYEFRRRFKRRRRGTPVA